MMLLFHEHILCLKTPIVRNIKKARKVFVALELVVQTNVKCCPSQKDTELFVHQQGDKKYCAVTACCHGKVYFQDQIFQERCFDMLKEMSPGVRRYSTSPLENAQIEERKTSFLIQHCKRKIQGQRQGKHQFGNSSSLGLPVREALKKLFFKE